LRKFIKNRGYRAGSISSEKQAINRKEYIMNIARRVRFLQSLLAGAVGVLLALGNAQAVSGQKTLGGSIAGTAWWQHRWNSLQ
jgi:hypothetical protein